LQKSYILTTSRFRSCSKSNVPIATSIDDRCHLCVTHREKVDAARIGAIICAARL